MPRRLIRVGLALMLAGALMLTVSQATAQPPATPTATPDILPTPVPISTSAPSVTPGATQRPDACEPNERPEDACAISLDAVSGPFTFLPPGDQDYYRLDLGPASGLTTVISVRGTSGLDLLTSISREDGRLLTASSSPAISTTLAADITGPIVIRIENRAPGDPAGQSYTIELRRGLPPAPTPPPSVGGAPTLTPDIAENNWSADTAAPIAVGVIYDLNLTCPVAWGCAGGDHDYLAVPVKAGGKYLICTFDLGPGVDTVLDLFWGNAATPLTSNDDIGTGPLSVIRWVAPTNGTALVRVGPRNGGMQQIVIDKERGFYRFAVTQANTPLARELEQRIAQQANFPTATPPAVSGAAGSGGSAPPAAPAAPATTRPVPSPASDAPTGEAVVIAKTTILRDAPGRDGAAILELPQEAVVTLLGQVSGQYVRVQPRDGVIPGWIRGADLLRLDARDATTAPAEPPESAGPQAQAAPSTDSAATLDPTATSPPTRSTPQIVPLPTLTPVVSAPALRVPVALTVQVHQSSKAVIGPRDPANLSQPLVGVRVQLVNAFGDVLTEAITPLDGTVPLNRDVDAGSAIYVRLPTMGVQLGVQPGQTHLNITLPGGNL